MLRSRWVLFRCVVLGFAVAFATGCATTSQSYREGQTESGLATWYGAEQQGRLTANGERYDMRQLTAAHRHLPFGSMVLVTNKLNGKSVEVRINDRGPWADHDRIIDVSSAAADKLLMKQAGIVPVELEVLSLHRPLKIANRSQ